MKLIKSLLLVAIFTGIAITASAQNNASLKRAITLYEKQSYSTAIDLFEKGLKKEDHAESKIMLADAYVKTGNTAMAEFWYGQVVKNHKVGKATKLQYGLVLQSNGKYSEAKKWFEEYGFAGGKKEKTEMLVESCDWALEMMKSGDQYKITPLPYNGKSSDIAPISYANGLVFASTRRRGFFSKVTNRSDDKIMYDLYYAEPSLSSNTGFKVKNLSKSINTRFNEGPASLTPGQDTIYFTKTVGGKKNSAGMNTLQLYSSVNNGTKWEKSVSIPFNSEEFSTAHAAISPKGDVMIFASNRPGGKGGYDLWMTKMKDGSWTQPKNLGDLNSEGNELFPAFHSDGTLFFSSNGHMGMGGLDIFSAKASGSGYGNVENGGYPLNSGKDDFAVSWIKGSAKGYFSSNRAGGMGSDDIYAFTRRLGIKLIIVDSRTEKVVEGATVTIMDVNSNKSKYTSNEDGEVKYFGDKGKDYFVTVEKEEYLPKKERLNTKGVGPTEDIEKVIPIEKEVIFSVFGTVTEADSMGGPGPKLEGAQVRIVGQGLEKKVMTEGDGTYFSPLEFEQDFNVIVSKDGFIPQVFDCSTIGKVDPEDFKFDVALVKGNYTMVEGTVVKKPTGMPLPGAIIRAINTEDRKELKSVISRIDGRFFMVLDPSETQIVLVGSREKYFSARVELPIPSSVDMDTTIFVNVEMVPYKVGALVQRIYYDYNKSDITESASNELFEIVYFLVDNPEANVVLTAHTDSRGSRTYNMSLSKRRAESAVEFIREMGIEKERITSDGKGENELVNRCGDGVDCPNIEHQENRRCELNITGIEDNTEDDGAEDSGENEAPDSDNE